MPSDIPSVRGLSRSCKQNTDESGFLAQFGKQDVRYAARYSSIFIIGLQQLAIRPEHLYELFFFRCKGVEFSCHFQFRSNARMLFSTRSLLVEYEKWFCSELVTAIP